MDIYEIYSRLLDVLVDYKERDLLKGFKRIIVSDGDKSLHYDFVTRTSRLTNVDCITAHYIDKYLKDTLVITSAEQAIQMAKDYLPAKVKKEKLR